MDAAGDSCGAGPLGILLTMYALAYSAASHPADFSRAEQCDLAASRMLDAVLAASAGSDIFPNSDKWEQAMLMDLTASLFQYVVPEDMEKEPAVGVYRMTAAAWTTLRPSLRPARPLNGSCHCPRISPLSPPFSKGSARCGC